MATPKPTALTYTIGVASDPGKRRSRNEDSVFAATNLWNTYTSPSSSGLFVLADGTGGYADGQEASREAIQTIINFIWPKIVRSTTLQPKDCFTLLTKAVQLANTAVHQQNVYLHTKWHDDDVTLGTTVTVAMIIGSTVYIANVGNSRVYHYRASAGLKQVTTDHTITAQLIAAGMLKPDDYTHSKNIFVTRLLGNKPSIEVDIFTIRLQPGDILLLCSSLWYINHNPDPDIEAIISHTPLDSSKAARELIQSALDAGGGDNVSALVVSIAQAKNRALIPGIQRFAIPNTIHLP